ncbi:HYR domain-containing protein [Cryomorpha ignava]|uniref:HYR domain-containing protein n=1 Tax=Cryomorpha ignava TaxID=101383 RepID=A0A7K3WPJ4_9FLAO|nr:HYR domain-containing protein [Cryomorpha ignava]NEN23583.1 HYR domain-containing protein [Cryomorpha ignava]
MESNSTLLNYKTGTTLQKLFSILFLFRKRDLLLETLKSFSANSKTSLRLFTGVLLMAGGLVSMNAVAQNVGFFETYVVLDDGSGNEFYDSGATTGNPDFQGANLGVFSCGSSMYLGGQGKTFKCSSCDVTATRIFWRIWSGSASGTFSPVEFGFGSNDAGASCSGGQNQTWQELGAGKVDVLDGLTPGNYSLEVYFEGNSSGGCTDPFYDSNSGNNYIASFSIGSVVNTSISKSYCSIQAAIDDPATLDGHTISVSAGIYDEVVSINKQISLLGPNSAISAVDGTRVSEARLLQRININEVENVTVSGFEFFEVTTTTTWTIYIQGNTNNFTFENNRFIDIERDAIRSGITSSTGNITVTGNLIEGITDTFGTGILLGGIYGTSVISDNKIDLTNTGYSGIQTPSATGLIISGNEIANTTNQGLQLAGTCGNVVIENNNIFNTNTSGGADKGAIRLYGTTFTGPITITGNILTSSFNGVAVKDGEDITGKNIVVENNDLSGNSNAAIYNGASAGTIEAPCNWYGTAVSADIPAEISGQVNYVPYLNNGTDNAPTTAGFQPVPGSCEDPVRVYSDVAETMLVSSHATIQAAINEATTLDGYVVRVDAGIYDEVVSINKQISLLGPNSAISAVDGTRVSEARLLQRINIIEEENVTVSGFEFFEVTTTTTWTIYIQGNTNNFTFENNRFIDIERDAIRSGITSSTGNITVTGNLIEGITESLASGFNFGGIYGTSVISDNKIDLAYGGNPTGYAGIQTPSATGLIISGNEISNTTNQGLQLAGTCGNVVIENNNIFNTNTSGGADKGAIRLYGTTFTGPITITGNILTSSFNGVAVKDGEDITGKNIVVENNDLSGNSNAAIYNGASAGTIEAPCNWYGTAVFADIPAEISGQVNYVPYLNNGTDDAPATGGFQPVAGSCVGLVRVYSDQAETMLVSIHTTIQAAVDEVTTLDGYFLRVDAGIYNESVIVDKSLTILGPNSNISPITGTRVAEAILVNTATGRSFSIRSGNTDVTISGFKFDGGSPIHDAHYINNPRTSDVTFSNNLVLNSNLIFAGTNTSWADVVISDNKFQDVNATPTTSALYLFNTNSTTVTGNTFVNVNYAAILIDGTPTVNISGNTIDGTGAQAIQLAGVIGSTTIEDNDINNANFSEGVDKGAIRLYGSGFTGAVLISGNSITGGHNGIAVKSGENITGKNITVTGNSITNLTSGVAIYHGGTGTLSATCNWYGTTDAQAIDDAVIGNVTYLPVLLDGTDNNPGAIGFDPAGDCSQPPYASFILTPSTTSVAECTEFTILVSVETTGPLNLAEAHFNFDPAELEVISINAPGGGTLPSAPLQTTAQPAIIDNVNGTFGYGATTTDPAVPSSDFDLFEVTFRALGSSGSTTITHILTGNPKSLIAYSGFVGGIAVSFDLLDGTDPATVNLSPDVTAPNAVCQDLTLNLDATGNATITANDIDNGSSDACGIATLVASQTTFDCSDIAISSGSPLIITGIIDGDLSGGLPKAIELYVVEDINDLSDFGIGSANNGGGSDGEELTLSGSAVAGTYIYVGSESTKFNDFFGFAPDFTDSAVGVNGDDAIELFQNGVVIDVFGDINTDGTNEAWEYSDGWAYRINETGPDGSTFVSGNWTYSGEGALDGETQNSSASTPFPLRTYSPAPAAGTQVTLTVTDINGNISTCTANVTVLDNIAPSAICNDFTVSLDASGNATITASDIDNSSSDACGIASMDIDNSAFTCADLGENTVTLTVTDANGNSSACTSTVTVIDDISPVVNCTNITAQLDASGNVTVSASDLDDDISDNCGSVSFGILGCPGDLLFDQNVTPELINGSGITNGSFTIDNGDGIELGLRAKVRYPSPQNVFNSNNDGSYSHAVGAYGTGSVQSSWNFDWSINTDQAGTSGLHLDELTYELGLDYDPTDGVDFVVFDPINIPYADHAIGTNGTGNGGGAIAADPTEYASFIAANNVAQNSWRHNFFGTFDGTQDGRYEVYLKAFDSNGEVVAQTAITVIAGNGTGNAYAGCLMPLDSIEYDCSNVGTNNVTLLAYDASGNSSACAATITVEDNVAPVAVCQDIDVYVDANGDASIVATDIDGGSTDNCGIASVTVDRTNFDCNDISSPVAAPTFALVISGLLDGPLSGGTPKAVELYVAQDIADLSIYGLGIAFNGDPSISQSFALSGSASAGSYLYIASGNADFNTFFGFNPDFTSSVTAFNGDDVIALFENGTVIDTFGELGTDGTGEAWEYLDGWAYRMNGIAPNAGVFNVANWSYSGINALDGESTNASAATPFPIEAYSFGGTSGTDVILTVTDVNGNSSTCNAAVTVLDTIAPAAVCQNITVQLDGNGQAIITTAQIDDNSTDNCTISSFSLSQTTFDCSHVGSNSVTLTVTDASGNSSTCTATVTVEDNVAPTAICQDITVQLDSSGGASIGAGDIDNGSSDACGITSLSVSQENFTCSDVGSNAVTLTVTDINNNVSTCTATVTVEDNIAPAIVCASDASRFVDQANNTYEVQGNEFDATASDNCSVSTITHNAASIADAVAGADNVSLDGWQLPAGVNTVTFTASDANGNSATCDVIITVEENTLSGNVAINADCAPIDMRILLYDAGTPNLVGTFIATIDANGDFSVALSGVLPGTYDVFFKAERYLQQGYLNQTISGSNVYALTGLIPGDISGGSDVFNDNVINSLDLSLIVGSYNTQPGDANYNERCDLNCDGQVDGLDLSLLIFFYLEVGDSN